MRHKRQYIVVFGGVRVKELPRHTTVRVAVTGKTMRSALFGILVSIAIGGAYSACLVGFDDANCASAGKLRCVSSLLCRSRGCSSLSANLSPEPSVFPSHPDLTLFFSGVDLTRGTRDLQSYRGLRSYRRVQEGKL